MAALGYLRRTSRYLPSEAAKPKPIGSRMGSTRKGTPCPDKAVDGFVEPGQGVGIVRDRDHLDPPVSGSVAVAAIDAKDELRAGADGRRDLARVETVDGDAKALGHQGARRVGDACPGPAGIAADVDDIGAGSAQTACLLQKLCAGQLRRVIDFGDNGNVVGPVV